MGVFNLFRRGKKSEEKSSTREAEREAVQNRSLDGTYKPVMVYYSPENRYFTPRELHMEDSELSLSGNRFEIYSCVKGGNSMRETGTFSVEKNDNGWDKITFYINDDELFGTASLIKSYTYTEIVKLTIVNKHYRLSQFGLSFRQGYEKQ